MDNNELEIQLTYLRMQALEEEARVGATFEALEGRVDAIEDVPLPAWGGILGSLSDQTDLQDALDTIVTDHGALAGLADDDHPQYHDDTRGDARYYTQAQVSAAIAAQVITDHTSLTGLSKDDHTQYLLADGTRTLAGNLTVTGTVDGRDVATDGTKLDGIEAGADVTDATNVNAAGAVMESDFSPAFSLLVQQSGTGAPEILQVGTDTIVGRVTSGGSEIDDLSPTQVRSLLNVEDGATADQTGAQIKVAYEAEANTNAFTDDEQTKLSLCTTSSSTAPSSPSDGELWMDLGSHSIYYWDATNSLWLDTCRENLLWGKPGASGAGSGFFLLSANLNLGTYGLEIEEDMILDSVAFSSDGTTSGSWTFRVKKNGTQIYGLAAPTSGSYDRVYSGDLIGSGYTFAAGDRISTEFGSGAGSASMTDSSLIVYYRRTI